MNWFQLVLIFALCFSVESSTDLLNSLQLSAGVYTTITKNSSYDFSRTVIVTAANFGYLNHLQNLRCFLKRLDMKALVLSMDKKIHEHLTSYSNLNSYLWKHHSKVSEESTNFRSPQFHLISMYKIAGVLDIIKLNYNVIFIDPDVAILYDPIPFMIFSNIDYVHSSNERCDW